MYAKTTYNVPVRESADQMYVENSIHAICCGKASVLNRVHLLVPRVLQSTMDLKFVKRKKFMLNLLP